MVRIFLRTEPFSPGTLPPVKKARHREYRRYRTLRKAVNFFSFRILQALLIIFNTKYCHGANVPFHNH